ncbi:MAG TPA: xanthine dehydrogenase molybdopterin binding subunit [Myxococcaceae bacterium]|nr:xanthine dehydrogenase molybdopterin binding subunit [Myxococcaceae bacterium]
MAPQTASPLTDAEASNPPSRERASAGAIHESAYRHVTGEARYVDDLPLPAGCLFGWVVTSPHPHARVTGIDTSRAKAAPGVRAVLTAADIPGHNDVGAIIPDEPLFAEGEVHTVGQAVAFVVADTATQARKAAALVEVGYEPLPALLTIDAGIAAGAFLSEPHTIQRGEPKRAIAEAPVQLAGEVRTGAQEHFYLETQASLVVPEEGGTLRIACSTQHPSEVQAKVAEVLGKPRSTVVVEVPRMGGGFGGKESQAAPYACMAALAALSTGRPVKVWLNRDQDMTQTGRRHPFFSRFEAGFSKDGQLLGLEVDMFADGGWANDLSRSVLDRGLFHLDNAYFLPHVRCTGRVVKTNLPSNTAFRGFGGPQGIFVIEEILNRAAAQLGLDPVEIRRRNFYGGEGRDTTHYGQKIQNDRLPDVMALLESRVDLAARQADIAAFNAQSGRVKRGGGLMPVKFGISFTASHLNQAGALVQIYADGSVQLNHGGTEMGQGLHSKMLWVAATELGIPVDRIRAMTTATDKVPNTSATAASSGADLNGMAVRAACVTLRERLAEVACRALGLDPSEAAGVGFEEGEVFHPKAQERLTFEALVAKAYMQQVSLSATGYYRTPDIAYDPKLGRGTPFHYFAYGVAWVELEVNGLTGEHRLLRVDIAHDVGESLADRIDIGQIEGAFLQGWGWLTCEEILHHPTDGRLLTHSAGTYKIPAYGDAPLHFEVSLLRGAPQPGTIHGSKAVGEPPFMFGIGAVTALHQAIAAFGPPGREVRLSMPATAESVLRAVVLQQV